MAPLLPSNVSKRDRIFESTRRMVEGIVYRYRYGIAWSYLPRERFGPCQSVWKRRRYVAEGTRDHVLSDADVAADIAWNISVDGTGNRTHQRVTSTTRPDQDTGGCYTEFARICSIRRVNRPGTASVARAVS